MPLKPNLSFSGLEEFVNEPIVSEPTFKKPEVETSVAKASADKPKVVRKNNGAPIIEEWVSDSEDEDELMPKIEKKTVKPSFAKIKFVKSKKQVKSLRKTTVKQGNMSYLTDFEEIDGGYVTFGGNPKGRKITGKGTKACDDAGKASIETVPGKDYILLPLWTVDPPFSQSSKSSPDAGFKPSGDDEKKVTEEPRKEGGDLSKDSECSDQEKEDNVNNTNTVNASSTNEVNVVGAKTSIELPDDPNMPELEDIVYSDDDEDVGAEADMNNLDAFMPVSPIPTTRVHKDHPVEQIIRDLNSTPQTRRMTKNLEEHGLFSSVQQRTNHKDFQNCLFACFLSQEEPKKVIHALKDPSWIEAMQEELLQFKNKKDERGIVIKNKARFVAQGYIQEEGIDYDKVFAHVARIEAIRLFLAYVSFKDFVVYQMDVKSAFLYGKIEEEVYVCQPTRFEDLNFPDKVYKVEKVLYGLHQAPRAWYETLSTYLLDNRFQRGKIDKTLFIRRDKGDILLVQVYVDDIIFGSTKKSLCTEFEKMMHKKFQMSSMGELTFFLGLQVKQKEDGIFISQDKYVTEILKKFSFTDVKTASTPMETQKPLLKDEDGEEVDVHLYRSMIGSLMYLTSSRPDIMFAVCACARYQVNPKVSHLHAVKRIFRYLKGQPKLGLWYPKDSPFDLVAYTDSDYAGASLDRKSTIGATVKVKIVNGEVQLQALVDGKKIIVTEAFVRRDLQLNDEEVRLLANAYHFLKNLQGWDKAVYKEMDDSLMRATTTASSLEAEQDSGNIDKTRSKETPNEPSSLGTSSGGGPRRQDTMGDIISRTRSARVISSDEASLGDQEDSSKQGRKIDDIDKDVEITLVDENSVESFGQALAALKSAKVQEKANVVEETKPKDKGLIIHEEEQETTPTVSSQQPSQVKAQDKGKGIMVEEPMKIKKKDQISLDKEHAFKLIEVVLDKEEVATDAIPLATKPPSIVNYKIYKEGNKTYYQIIRADGSSKMYLVFSHMLKSFNREDLETLWKLVAFDLLRDALSAIFGLSELKLLEQALRSPEYVPDPIELEDHVPVYIPEPEHHEDLVPAEDEAPTPPLPTSFLSPRIRPPHTRAAMAQMRAAAPSTYHPLLLLGTPPLLPIPLPAPSTSRRADIPEVDTPSLKRLLLTAPRPGCEVGESYIAAAARQPRPTIARRVDCSSVDTVDVRSRESSEFYSRHHDAQKDRAAVRAEIEVLRRERLIYEQESMETCQALTRSEAYSRALEARVTVLETQARRHEWQRQDADDHATRHIMRIQALEAGARNDTLEDTGSSA
ncbi:putative ribonuclease H-like domain-containing protein [Tanacetum coccineum]